MWKFKASKFKNAAPRFPKKEEWISDISTNNLLQSYGNHIKASSAFMVFNIDNSGGSNLGILPLEHKGRVTLGNFPTIQAHSEYVTDFCFSPFDDYLLSTCSQDCEAKLWKLPDEITDNVRNPLVTFAKEEKKIENVSWHPASDNILTLSTGNAIKIYDVESQTACYDMAVHGDIVQSFTWSPDGKLLVTSCKDKKLRILDPRANSVVQEASGHSNQRDSRALWVSETTTLSSGFDMTRQREVIIKDVRNFSSSLRTMALDTSTGILIPLYDPDTNMLFLAGKGDTSVHFKEITEKSPYINDGSVDTVEQIKGAALVPKRALDVMECEVNRVLLLSKNTVIPLPYHVPRKSYRDFHEDLFPDTLSGVPSMTASEWLSGENKVCTKITLNPSQGATKIIRRDPSGKTAEANTTTPTLWTLPKAPEVNSPELNQAKPAQLRLKPVVASKPNASSSPAASGDSALLEPVEKRKVKKFTGVRQSKFRHLEGVPMQKDLHFTNLRNISQNIPGESNMFDANTKFCAVPLGGPGGLLAIIRMDQPGKLPSTALPALQNRSMLMDFKFDPFDDHRIVTACDDAKLRIWTIPENGLEETIPDPDVYLHGHTEKIYFVAFNPVARDLLASGSYDMTVRLWDLSTQDQILQLEGHTDTIFSFAWSADGSYCASVCKDGKLRVYDPRQGSLPSQEGPGPEGTRGARVVWVLGGKYIIVSGFDKTSVRVVSIYDSSNISKGPLHREDLDTSPAILIPYYDEDSSTLLLTGRGDSLVKSFEVAEDYPHLFAMADYKAENALQGLAVLPKHVCNVKQVEFIRSYQLTTNSIEPVSFTVPRVKMEFFQDDLFPDTRVKWEPLLTCSEWLSGVKTQAKYESLKPADMISLSDAPKEAPKESKYENFREYSKHYKTDEEKKEELLSAMNAKLELTDQPLPQDLTEGVDDDEWDDY